MKIRLLYLVILFSLSVSSVAQTKLRKQRNLQKWAVPSANYSGITPLGDNRYAIISDKQSIDGWSEVRVIIDERKGKIKDVDYIAFHASPLKARDAEGIIFTGTNIFISAEDDQRILEYNLDGIPTGRELAVPVELGKENIVSNYGFEALAYDNTNKIFYTCTENTIKTDGSVSSFENPVPAKIRIQSFGENLNATHQYLYLTDAPSAQKKPLQMAFGIPEMTVLEDGSLLVMEREFFVAKKYLGSYVKNKIYRVKPTISTKIPLHQKIDDSMMDSAMEKSLVAEWTTRLNITRRGIANYEGMCLGPKLKDGRQTILLVSDSQGGFGNSLFHLKDYIKVIIL